MSETKNKKGKKNLGIRLLTWILAAMLGASGAFKIAGVQSMADNYANWGYPAFMLFVVGAAELLGVILLLLPKTASFASGWLGLIMVGAITTHVMAGEWGGSIVPMVLFGLLTVVGWAHRCQAFEFMQQITPWLGPPTCREESAG